MLDKVVELVKKYPKISDFHLRSNCAFSYRLLGEIQSIQENTDRSSLTKPRIIPSKEKRSKINKTTVSKVIVI